MYREIDVFVRVRVCLIGGGRELQTVSPPHLLQKCLTWAPSLIFQLVLFNRKSVKLDNWRKPTEGHLTTIAVLHLDLHHEIETP